jgi:hypothetical protein
MNEKNTFKRAYKLLHKTRIIGFGGPGTCAMMQNKLLLGKMDEQTAFFRFSWVLLI